MDLSRLIEVYFNAGVAWTYLPDLLHGAWVTVSLSVLVIAAGLVLGLAMALLRLVLPRWGVEVMRLWVDCLRAVPPLAVILLLYFGLPSVGLSISAFWVIWITLTLILSAFAEEIFWAGLEAIPAGQWEAARSTGMTQRQTLADVVLPQAFKICVPQLTNRTIGITKNTALGTAIGMPELLNEAQTALSFSGNATPLIMAAIGYLIIFLPLMALAGYLERSMSWGKTA
ncbi:amino acid ABC transporter permease [Mangrovicoccus algicola]|uniref:Amino acid ABC transporter permease n=1 Tax=Mangrovicoccus algicola TaxID=2771008 RepID=A0A8J6YY81_9RHOB|nr:amino acid ABC transporter permease [Mangrovicoccus algicola]MBE3638779.1 amino acid ABC transporter permease [Mangrovicoccus algicola]